jgi:hypothetical protein
MMIARTPTDASLDAYSDDDAFDLDVRIVPTIDREPVRIKASGTCGGCPDWSEEGSSCKTSCEDSCGGTCTCPGDGGGDCGFD